MTQSSNWTEDFIGMNRTPHSGVNGATDAKENTCVLQRFPDITNQGALYNELSPEKTQLIIRISMCADSRRSHPTSRLSLFSQNIQSIISMDGDRLKITETELAFLKNRLFEIWHDPIVISIPVSPLHSVTEMNVPDT
jgi:hypothetical protein